MKKRFFTWMIAVGIGLFFLGAYAEAKDEPCGDNCKNLCQGQSYYQANVLGTTENRCKIGLASGNLKTGESCTTSSQCASGLYCDSKCVAKKAIGVSCNDCAKECSSGKFTTDTSGSMSVPRKTCSAASGQDPAKTGTSSSTTSKTGVNGQYYSTEKECVGNCGGGNCERVSTLSSFRCNMPNSPSVPTAGGATAGGLNSSGSVIIKNPLEFNTVEEFLGAVLSGARKIIVVLALVFIVIGAIMYVVSAGQSGMMETAKKTITMAMVGLAIGIAAPSFLKEISSILGWKSTDSSMSGALTLSQIAMNVLNFLLGIFGTLAIIMLLIGGIMYLTSAGDDDRIQTGKKIFKYSVIGIVLALASLVIVQQIARFFA